MERKIRHEQKLLEEKEKKQQEQKQADELCAKSLKRSLLRKLRTATQIQRYEEEQDMNKKSETAYAFNEFNQKMSVLNSLRQHCKIGRADAQLHQQKVRNKYLLKRTFALWVKLQDFLRKENQILDAHRANVVNRFRQIKLGRRVLMALQDEAQDAKIQKEKDVYKIQMRNKVNQWLTDFDKKGS